MARKSDSKPINNEKLDRRVKLTTAEKEVVRYLHNSGGYSQNDLALKYGVSKRTIQFTLYPEKLEENKKRRQERGGTKQYYDKDKHNQYMKTHRDYKKELNNQGKL